MLETTRQIIRSALKGDQEVKPYERARFLAILRGGLEAGENRFSEPPGKPTTPRIVRRHEAAQIYGCSLRLIDRLASQGVLRKVRLPGRERAAGFLESELLAVIGSQRD